MERRRMAMKDEWLSMDMKCSYQRAIPLLAILFFALHILPARASDLNVTSGTFEITAPGDVTDDRVLVDNTSDTDAAVKIDAGVTFGKDIILDNEATLTNEGQIVRTGPSDAGVYGNTGLAHVINQAGGTITVDAIGMWLKDGGSLLNTGTGSDISGRIGVDIEGTSTVTNEQGAEIHGGTGSGLYLTDSTVINRSGGRIISNGSEGVRISGTGNVTNTGEASAIRGDSFGVTIIGAGHVYNLDGASISGGSAVNIVGAGTVENEGSITSTNGSSAGVSLGSGGTLTNRTSGSISGYKGVFSDDAVAIDNAGSIEGTDTTGIDAQISGSSLNNHDGGTIAGIGKGIIIVGDITNTGAGSKISSDDIGARLLGGATLRNAEGAAIEGDYLGADMYDGGDVYNTGGSKIFSSNGNGINHWIYGSVTNSGEGSSITAGGNYGIYFDPYGEDSTFSLTNSDHATVSGDYTGVSFVDADGTVLSEGAAEISGGSYGVKFEGGKGTVTNQTGAAISGSAGSGIQMDAGGSVTNMSGGTITGDATGLGLFNGDDYTIINTDAGSKITATGPDGDAIFVAGPATITNADGALISGTRFGAWMDAGGSFTNEGEGTHINGDGTAIKAAAETTVENKSGASITGGNAGVDLESGGSVTNSTGASIRATDETHGIGVILTNGGTSTNESGATIYGAVRGVQGWGADITNTGSDSAITSDDTAVQTWSGGGSVTNDDGATMHGGVNGVLLDISTELENKGGATISGDTGSGIFSYDGGIVTNTGAGSTISGANAGIYLLGGPGTVTNADGASITGDYNAVALFQGGSVNNGAGSSLEGGTYGIYADGGGTTISNAGHITGDVVLSTVDDNDVTLYSGSSIDGNLYIDNRATSKLTFDGASDQLLSDAVTGSFSFGGTLTKQGSGTWTIDKNILATTTNVTQGGLIVGIDGHGNLISDVNVSAGALLGGSGTIYGDVVVDGTVTPGNSPGLLTVVGDYAQGAGSTFEAQIDTDTGLYDQINASGAATIASGATLHVTQLGSTPYVVGTQYVFLSATSVTGSYAVTGDLTISPFLTLSDHYAPGIGYLEVQQTTSLTAAVTSGSTNQTNLANGIQSAPTSGILNVLANMPSVAAVSALLPQLTGELHASVAGAMLDDSRYLRNAAIERLRDARCGSGGSDAGQTATDAKVTCGKGPWRTWSSAFGTWAHGNSAGDAASIGRTTGGVLVGADGTLNDFWRGGLLSGYAQSHYEIDGLRSSATSEDYHLGFYLGTLPGDFALRLGGFRTWHHITSSRAVAASGFTDHLDGDYHAVTGQAFIEAGYRLPATAGKVEPFVNLAHVDSRLPSFSETGGSAALTSTGKSNSVTLATLGVHGQTYFMFGDMQVSTRGTIGWRHAGGDTTPQARFEIGGGSAFDINGLPITRNALVAKADIDMVMSHGMSLGISGDGQFGGGQTALGLQARLAVQF